MRLSSISGRAASCQQAQLDALTPENTAVALIDHVDGIAQMNGSHPLRTHIDNVTGLARR